MNPYVRWTLKALAAAVASFIGIVLAGLSDNSLTWVEWLYAGGTGILAGLAVFGVPNGADPRKPQPINGTNQLVEPDPHHVGEHRAKDLGGWTEANRDPDLRDHEL